MIRLLLLASLLVSCGTIKVKGKTENTHKVEGEVTYRVKLEVDVCDEMTQEDKMRCLQDFVDILRSISGLPQNSDCKISSDGTIDTSKCPDIVESLPQPT